MPETKRPERGSFAATLASIRPGSDVDLADELRAVVAELRDGRDEQTLSGAPFDAIPYPIYFGKAAR